MSRINLEYFLARRIAFTRGGRKNNVMVRIATLSVAVGMAVMIVSLAVIFGFKHEITAKLTGFGSHVQIVNLDGNTSYETVPISKNQPVVPLIEKLPACGEIHPYAIKAGILRGEEAMQGDRAERGGPRPTTGRFSGRSLVRRFRLPVLSDTVRNKDVLHFACSGSPRMLKLRTWATRSRCSFIQNPPRRDRFRVKGIYDTQFR